MALRISRRARRHKGDGLNRLTEAHVISKNSSFMATLFLGLHPRQPDCLVLHQRDLERTWSFILVCFRRLSNIFDAGEQILDILREICFLVSPRCPRVSTISDGRGIETYTKSSSSISCSTCSRTSSMAFAAASVSPPHGSWIQGRDLLGRGGSPNRGGPPNRELK